jgi:hypothetical protein
MPEEKHRIQVFISYSRRDLDFVEQLVADLQVAGLDVWYDLSGLEGGARWRIEIERAIRESHYVLIVLSPDSVVSEWVEREYLFANNIGKKIIPLFYKPCDLPMYYLNMHFIDIQGDKYPKNYKEILRALDIKRSDREIAEKIILAKTEQETVEKVEREKVEREVAEKVAREESKLEHQEQRVARNAAFASRFSQFVESLKFTIVKEMPVFRVVGILGIIAILFWAGSRVAQDIIGNFPMMQSSVTSTITATELIADDIESPTATKTATPTATATETKTPIATATPVFVEGNTLFEDDFENGRSQGWRFFGPSSYWTVVEDDNKNFVLQGIGPNEGGESGAQIGSSEWTNYAISYRLNAIQAGDGEEVAFVMFVRSQSENSPPMYAMNLRMTGSGSLHRYLPDWTDIRLGDFYKKIELNNWYNIRVELFENQINVFVDDVLKVRARDTDEYLAYGWVDFLPLDFAPGQILWFDNVKVVELLPNSR